MNGLRRLLREAGRAHGFVRHLDATLEPLRRAAAPEVPSLVSAHDRFAVFIRPDDPFARLAPALARFEPGADAAATTRDRRRSAVGPQSLRLEGSSRPSPHVMPAASSEQRVNPRVPPPRPARRDRDASRVDPVVFTAGRTAGIPRPTEPVGDDAAVRAMAEPTDRPAIPARRDVALNEPSYVPRPTRSFRTAERDATVSPVDAMTRGTAADRDRDAGAMADAVGQAIVPADVPGRPPAHASHVDAADAYRILAERRRLTGSFTAPTVPTRDEPAGREDALFEAAAPRSAGGPSPDPDPLRRGLSHETVWPPDDTLTSPLNAATQRPRSIGRAVVRPSADAGLTGLRRLAALATESLDLDPAHPAPSDDQSTWSRREQLEQEIERLLQEEMSAHGIDPRGLVR